MPTLSIHTYCLHFCKPFSMFIGGIYFYISSNVNNVNSDSKGHWDLWRKNASIYDKLYLWKYRVLNIKSWFASTLPDRPQPYSFIKQVDLCSGIYLFCKWLWIERKHQKSRFHYGWQNGWIYINLSNLSIYGLIQIHPYYLMG